MNDINKIKNEMPNLYTILEKMCECVGITIQDVNWDDEEWFRQYEWSAKEQDQFIKWLYKFLNSKPAMMELTGHSIRNAKTRNSVAISFALYYGWKVKTKNEIK